MSLNEQVGGSYFALLPPALPIDRVIDRVQMRGEVLTDLKQTAVNRLQFEVQPVHAVVAAAQFMASSTGKT